MVPNSKINVTPYVDILLVLLIIFMVVQQPTNYQLSSRSSSSPENSSSENLTALVLSIDEDMNLAINSQLVRYPDLGRRLFELLSSRPDGVLFISGSEELPFGFVARIIDIAKGAGAGQISLMTNPGQEPVRVR